MDLLMRCRDLYAQSNVRKMMSYGSLSHMPPFLSIEDVCMELTNLASQKARDLQCIKVEMPSNALLTKCMLVPSWNLWGCFFHVSLRDHLSTR